ncbi:MAG TPA: pitrilysin family protein [Gemmatimonadales bacterium]
MSHPPTFGLRREQLSNGLTVLVQRRRSVPGVAVVTHVRAGFLDEPDEIAGISHVVEHLLFKGTPSLAPGELAQRTKALGGSLNAYTAYDRTVYFVNGPARHAAELIALQADQVRNPTVDPDELARELGVIIQEARRKLDTPGAVAGEALHQLLFEQHRIRRWRIGEEAVLERLTRDDILGYHRSRYVPSRTIVTVVGDLDEAAALDMVRASWSDWERPSSSISTGPYETSAPTIRARRLDGDVMLADLVIGWRAPGMLSDDAPALELATALLALGRGARLPQLLREPGLATDVGASWYGVSDLGVFAIGAEVPPANIDRVLEEIAAATTDLARREVSAAEFTRAQHLVLARISRRLERFQSRAVALADAEAMGDVSRLDRERAELLAVSPMHLREVAAGIFNLDAMSGVAYLPRNSEAAFDVDSLRRAAAVAASATTATASTGDDAGVDLSGVATTSDATSPPKRRTATAVKHGVHHLALDGCDILAARFGDIGQTAITLYRPRLLRESAANAGLAALGLRSMLRGSDRLDAVQLAFAIESLGGTISPSLGADTLGLGATVLTEHLHRATTLLCDVLHRPRFDEPAVLIERGLLADDARGVADDMVRFPVQLALGVAFGDAGYGVPTLGTPASVLALDTSAVRRWHQQMLGGGTTTIIAVGDDDPARVAEMIAGIVDRHGTASTADVIGGSAEPMTSILPGTRIERRDRRQSALAMLFPGPSRGEHERFAAETWSAIAGGLGGRLFESLRSARSLAYTVMANSWQRKEAGGLLTYIAMAPERLDEARAAMLEELAQFRREPPSAEEVERARAQLIGEVELSRQTASAFAGEIADAWILGEGLAELDDPAAGYRAVTVDQVHAVAQQSFDPAVRAEGVVAAVAAE